MLWAKYHHVVPVVAITPLLKKDTVFRAENALREKK